MKALDGLPTPDRLLALRSVAVLLGTRRAATVVVARSEGFSWAEIADRLGMSRQSVWERYGTEEGEVPQPARALALRPTPSPVVPPTRR
jgi:predicted DNA-binding transcriptional regulator AlpA